MLGGVGGKDDFDLAMFEVMEGVKEAHRIVSPYKLASRNFRPGGTVVKIGNVEIGGDARGGDGGAVQRGEPRADRALGGNGGARGRHGDSRRGLQAAQLALRVSGNRRRGPGDAAVRRPTATACWW